MSNRSLLFAYGTLMRGECRAHHLRSAEFVGEASTQPLYRLVNCGSYPGLLHVDRRGLSVQGEVWSVTEPVLRALDRVEGVLEGLYDLRSIRLLPPFDDRRVLAYFYLLETSHLPDCGPDWRRHTRGHST